MEDLKLLILEDSIDDAKLIQATLKRAGMQLNACVVSSRQEYVEALERFVPDVVISDHSIPNFSSNEALQICRQSLSLIPFLLVTGAVSDEFAASMIKDGADDYILKDRLSRLPAAIETALKQRRIEKENQETSEMLKYSEENYRTIMERVSDGFVALDTNWCYTYINKAAGKILQREPEDLMGKNIWTEFPEGVGKPFYRSYHEAMKEQRYIHLEEYYSPFGAWLENHIYPSPNGLSIFFRDITEKKKAEQQILQSEARLKQAQEIAHLGNWELNFETDTSIWSDEAYRIYGIEPGPHNFSIKDWLSYVHPDDQQYVKGELDRIDTVAGNLAFYYRIVRKDGTIRYLYAKSKYEFGEAGKPVVSYGIILDVTERKNAEEELLAANERLSFHIENTPLGFIEWDCDIKPISWSKRAEQVFGWTLEEFRTLKKNGYENIYKEDWIRASRSIEDLLSGAANRNTVQYRNHTRDGRVIWCEWFNSVLRDDDGKVITILSLVQDISERIKAGEDLRRSEIRLNEAQAMAHISNWEINLEKNEHTWSDEFYRIYGLDKYEVQPSAELFLSLMHPEDATLAESKVTEAFTTAKDSSFNFRFIRKDGALRYGYTEWKFGLDQYGKPVRLYGILQDITERREAELNFKMLEAKMLEQKVQEQKTIIRAVIKAEEKERNRMGQELHDNINQLLAGTKMYISIAANKSDELKELVKYPLELIDMTMEEIRMLCRKLVTPVKNIDLETLLRNILNSVQETTAIATSLNCSINSDNLSDNLKLNAYRIIQELVHNILKYAEAKTLLVSVVSDNKNISIQVKDDGRGFDVKQTRVGVGISNIINRVESYNGSVDIISSPGNGCSINIEVPVLQEGDAH